MNSMNFKSLLSLAAVVVSTGICNAQNELLMLKPGDSIPGVLSITDSSQWFEQYNYHVAPAPEKLVAAISLTVDYTKAANLSLNAFQRYPLFDYGISEPGVVLFPWLNEGFEGAVKPENEKTPVRESMKKALCSSKAVREMIYSWLMPYYQKAFSVMSVNEQEGYLKKLNEAKEFANNLDIEKEKKIAKKAVDYAGDVGHLHAFIYRRVANNELSKEECIEWLNKIITDLSAKKNTNPSPEDHYVLRSSHGFGIFLASVFNAKDTYAASYAISKKGENYTIVPNVSFDVVAQCGKNFLIGLQSHYPDPSTYGYLYYDSLGYFYKQVSQELPYGEPMMRGKGRAGRALLFYTPASIEVYEFDSAIGDAVYKPKSIGVCCVLDIDSGYIVQDSMYIPCIEKQFSEWGDKQCTYPAAEADYIIFKTAPEEGMCGILGPNGNLVLEPEYNTIEGTQDPKKFVLNGELLFDVLTGNKTRMK